MHVRRRIGMAADRSGNPRHQFEYLAIVLGEWEELVRLRTGLGLDGIHMSRMADRDRRRAIISAMKGANPNILALCIKVSSNVNKIKAVRSVRKRRNPDDRIYRTSDYLLLSSIGDMLDDFLVGHGCHMGDVSIECDKDCLNFARHCGMRPVSPGLVHDLADVIAWANQRGIEISWVIELDRVGVTYQRAIERLRR